MEKTVEVKVEDIMRAFDEANDNGKRSILKLFPKFNEFISVTDRVKTFDDACRELGGGHPYVLAYNNTNLSDTDVADGNIDAIAYLKLRIITAALNNGWSPQFAPGERRYFPYFRMYFDDDINQVILKEKSNIVSRSSHYAVVNGGVSVAGAGYDSAYVSASFGTRLAFKTRELAEYAGRQFATLYAEYLLNTK